MKVRLDLDGEGLARVKTGEGFLDHLLGSLAVHGSLDLHVDAKSLDLCQHHLVEDVAIVFGGAIDSALGEKRGIRRFGYSVVPMDDALAVTAVDLSGRGYANVEVDFEREEIEGLDTHLILHFLESMAMNGRFTLHVLTLRGRDDHHKAEAVFKSIGISLGIATRRLERLRRVPSGKGVL